MSGILVIGEVVGGSVTSQSLEAVAAARKLASDRGETLSGALFGADLAAAVAQFDASFSALLVLDSPQLGSYLAEPYVAAAELAIKRLNPSVVLLPHGSRTRDWVPQLAARLGAGLVLDCVGVGIKADGVAVTKPMHGGAVLGELFVRGSPAIVTLRGGAFEPALAGGGGNVEHLDMPPMPGAGRIQHLETVATETGTGPRLKDAKVIVSGGRGTGGSENWRFIEEAAAAIGAAVGCSRAIVDMGWLKWNHQVGLSGTIVAPDLYLAVGISGAVQHLAGISNAKTVVAINNDPDAEIFRRADYGVVGDFLEVLPAFTERAKELRK